MDLRDIKEFLTDTFKYIITAIAVIFLIVYIVTFQQVVGNSMSPTLKDQDIVILNKIHYHIFKIKRFDVIALKYNDTKYLIKRVIGLPGDKIEYKDNILYVNDKAIKEEFLNFQVITEDFSINDLGYTTIPENKFLVLGDNRPNSLDSRKIGLISKKEILGKVNIKIWPITNIKFVK